MEEKKIPTLATILPGYKESFENPDQDIRISDILGITEDEFNTIAEIAEMFFITENSYSLCIKKTLEIIQEKKNLTSYSHALAVLLITAQVRERHAMVNLFHNAGIDRVMSYQPTMIVQSLRISHELGLGDYFSEQLADRIIRQKKQERKEEEQSSVMKEAEEAVKKLLKDKNL